MLKQMQMLRIWHMTGTEELRGNASVCTPVGMKVEVHQMHLAAVPAGGIATAQASLAAAGVAAAAAAAAAAAQKTPAGCPAQ